MALTVHITPGRLPEFWSRSAIYFANIHSLFFGNDAETAQLESDIKAISSYGGRLASVMGLIFRESPNMLVLESEPDRSHLDYLAIDLGIKLPDFHVIPQDRYKELTESLLQGNQKLPPELEPMSSHPAPWIDGFVTDQGLESIAASTGKKVISRFQASKNANNKLLLHRFLVENGMPTFDTIVAEGPESLRAGLKTLREQGYRKAVAKSQIGASGCGIYRLKTTGEDDSLPEHAYFEGACLLQGWLDEDVEGIRAVGSPSVQFFIAEESATLFDITDQILSDACVHEGNISPPPSLSDKPKFTDKILRDAAEITRFIHSQGYRGTGSVDFLVVEQDDELRAYVCEVNARVTGATYPSVLARRFAPDGAWLMRNLRFPVPFHGGELLQRLRETNRLFLPGKADGILPINFNVTDDRLVQKGQFLALAADGETCGRLLSEAANILGTEWTYDRD